MFARVLIPSICLAAVTSTCCSRRTGVRNNPAIPLPLSLRGGACMIVA
jgi:hypothetical protein